MDETMNSTILLLLCLAVLVLCLGLVVFSGKWVRNRRRKTAAYALEPDGEKRLEISSNKAWKETKVYLDGNLVRILPDKKALLSGQEIFLPDGSILKLQLAQVYLSYNILKLWRNGKPLPGFGPGTDRLAVQNAASGVVYSIGIISFIAGFAAILFRSDLLQQLGIGSFSLLFALLFLVLGFFSERKSRLALLLAVLIYALDGAAGIYLLISHYKALIGNSAAGYLELIFLAPWALGFVIIHILFLVPMVRGAAAFTAPDPKTGTENIPKTSLGKIILIMLISSGALVVLWGALKYTSRVISPTSQLPPTPSISPVVSSGEQSGSNICWTGELKGFSGNRYDAWEKLLGNEMKKLLPFERFKNDVLQYNPQLKADGYVFDRQKSYLFPELCP